MKTNKTLGFSKKVKDEIKYYVYRLVNPLTLQTFYVGKGTGNRCFDHIKKAYSTDTQKSQIIRQIQAQGKEVMILIHRWGLSAEEAKLVEASLMDCYYGLSNIQSGYYYEKGLISIKDIETVLNAPVYKEPAFNYVLIKTKFETVSEKGLYEAIRSAWRMKLDKAKSIKYVFAVVDGLVKGVFDVEKWMKSQEKGRIEFVGKENIDLSAKFMDHSIPEYYRKKGMSNPALYCKQYKENTGIEDEE